MLRLQTILILKYISNSLILNINKKIFNRFIYFFFKNEEKKVKDVLGLG